MDSRKFVITQTDRALYTLNYIRYYEKEHN